LFSHAHLHLWDRLSSNLIYATTFFVKSNLDLVPFINQNLQLTNNEFGQRQCNVAIVDHCFQEKALPKSLQIYLYWRLIVGFLVGWNI